MRTFTLVEEGTGPEIGEGGLMVFLVAEGRAEGVFMVLHMGG